MVQVKIEDGRVGYIYTHNMKLTPPDDIAREVPFMRIVAWRTVNGPDDPDRGAKNNYIAAYAPVGKDPGCDYTRLYLMNWTPRHKKARYKLAIPNTRDLAHNKLPFRRETGLQHPLSSSFEKG